MTCAATACSDDDDFVSTRSGQPPNFLVIVVDTLRADRIDPPGRTPERTPHIDALRRESIDFSHARTTSSWTLPATVSLLVSQLPSEHGAAHWGSTLDAGLVPLSEVLHGAGYRTGGWSANRLVVPERGFDRGFDHFELVVHPEWQFGTPGASPFAFATADMVIDRALEWFDATPPADPPAPYFAYLHWMEPHTPYFCAPDMGPDCPPVALDLARHLTLAQWDFTPEQQKILSALYDADVRLVDAALARLMTALEARGLLDDTWIILTADHGEMLGEHGLYVHGNGMREEVLRVPLLIRSPTRRAVRVETAVSLIDVAPTILAAAGLSAPVDWKGQSLLDLAAGKIRDPMPLVAELLPVRDEPDRLQRHLAAVVEGQTKWVLWVDGRVERIDLATDPGELNPRPVELGEFKAVLARAGVHHPYTEAMGDPTPTITPEMREQLEGLGYVHE